MNFSKEFGQRYEVQKSLGQGGMGEVVLAKDLQRGGLVAIKTVLASSFADDEARLRFLREARITSALSHPNIIRVIDQGTDDGKLFIVFEYVEGGGLGALIREKGPLKPAQFFGIACGILDAVTYAHRQGVLHRDLKTDNVLLDRSMQPRVADFGLAKGIDNAGLETVSGTMMGTPIYMAPELARAQPASASTDQYALGVILYTMLAGKPPLYAENPLEMLEKHCLEKPKPVTVHRPEVPKALADAIHRALQKTAAERWPEVADLRDAVNSLEKTAQAGWTAMAMAAEKTHTEKPHGGKSHKGPQPVLIPIPDDPAEGPNRTSVHPPIAPAPVLIPIKDDAAPTGRAKRTTGPAPVVIPVPEPVWKPSMPVVHGEPPQPTTPQLPPPSPAPKRRSWTGIVVGLLALNALVLGWRSRPAPTPPSPTPTPTPQAISITSFNEPVRGALGLPLGQVATVEGVAVAGSSTGRKADADLTLLKIEKVGDRQLAHPVQVPFTSPAYAGVKAPEPGKKFKLTGYETGAFTGFPHEAAKVTKAVPATTAFAWTVQFEVLRDDSK